MDRNWYTRLVVILLVALGAVQVARPAQLCDGSDLVMLCLADTAAVEETNIIRLTHASADEVVNLINRLEQQRRRGGAATADAGQEGFSIAADKRTNSVLINGDEVQRARLKTMVRYLDVPLQESGNATVIYLEYASAVDVAEVLGRVLSNISRLEADKTKETTGRFLKFQRL